MHAHKTVEPGEGASSASYKYFLWMMLIEGIVQLNLSTCVVS